MITVKQTFDLAIKMGSAVDPRGTVRVKKYLDSAKKEYEEVKAEEKEYFDTARLNNPYSDSRIHAGNENAQVKRVLAGIDIGAAEILLASQLNERGKKIDLIIGHHPIGQGLAGLHDVMDIMVDVFADCGMPVHTAEKLMEERIKEVGRSVHPANHYQIIDCAKLLGVNVMNTHTPTDNLVQNFLNDFIAKEKPETIGDLMKVLLKIPEYREAKRRGAGPKIFAGNPKHRVGKYLVEMTGGTSPSKKVYQELSRAGISTLVDMHIHDDSMAKANEFHMNVVVAGHISSDSLGMNLFLDELEKKGVEVVPCSGLIRVNRNKKK